MFIPNFLGIIQRFVLTMKNECIKTVLKNFENGKKNYINSLVVNVLENILEPSIIFLQDCILGAEIKRVLALKSVLERRVSKVSLNI